MSCSCLFSSLGFAACLPVLCRLAGFVPCPACSCGLVAFVPFPRAGCRRLVLPLACLFRAVSCLYLWFGCFRAVSCLCLFSWLGLRLVCLYFVAWPLCCRFLLVLVFGFAACLPVLVVCLLSCRFPIVVVFVARFCRLHACTLRFGFCSPFLLVLVFVARFCRLPACTLWLGWFRAVSCLYASPACCVWFGWFVARVLPLFVVSFLSCRFLFVFVSVARFGRLPACTLSVGWFRAVFVVVVALFFAWLASLVPPALAESKKTRPEKRTRTAEE